MRREEPASPELSFGKRRSLPMARFPRCETPEHGLLYRSNFSRYLVDWIQFELNPRQAVTKVRTPKPEFFILIFWIQIGMDMLPTCALSTFVASNRYTGRECGQLVKLLNEPAPASQAEQGKDERP